MTNLSDICIHLGSTIEKAIKAIGCGNVKIALVVDSDNRLLGTLSDGDFRRGILKGKVLNDVIDDIYHANAISSNENISREELLNLCSKNQISQIPIVNKDNQIVDLFVLDEILTKKQHKNTVVLMVGGLGTRLMPLTENIPKPMLKVGENPILQTIIEGFSKYGFTNFIMCLGYKSNLIQDYFQDGKAFGVNIEYVVEDKRMGTAGALTLLQQTIDKPFFVMNGDILTSVNYEQLLDFHESNKSRATMCVREYDIEVPYGVVELNDENIISIKEKPIHSFFVNAGIYLLEPECIDLIPNNEFYDMPVLFEKLLDLEEKIISYPLKEYWLDIGHINEYKKANKEYKSVFET
jgi:dTDP-glucose pyrophosphorylase